MKPSVLSVLRRFYEPFMAVTALVLAASVAVSYAFRLGYPYGRYLSWLDWFTYGVFAVDFLVRLYVSRPRGRFLAQHWLDLLALLPVSLLVPVLRWYRAVRGFIMLRRYSDFFHGVFLRHGFAYIVAVTFGLVIGGAYAIQRVEPGLGNFGDALWWSFVTTTTVGYGDIAPKTAAGRAVAVVLMLLGIGFIGLFTGTVATFFVERSTQRQHSGPLAEQVEALKARMDRLDELSPAEFEELQLALDAIYAAYARRRKRSARTAAP